MSCGDKDIDVDFFDDQDEDPRLDWEAEDEDVQAPYWQLDIRLPLNNETLESQFWEHDERVVVIALFFFALFI